MDIEAPDVSEWKNLAAVRHGFNFAAELREDGRIDYADNGRQSTATVQEALGRWPDVANLIVEGQSKTMGPALNFQQKIILFGKTGGRKCIWNIFVGTVVFGNFDAMWNYIKQVDVMLGNKPFQRLTIKQCALF